MNISVTLIEQIAIAHLDGDVDLANGMHFTDALLDEVPDGARALVVDMTDLTYIDSAGIRSIFEVAGALRMREQELALAVPEDSLLRSVLKITSVEEVAAICLTVDEAVARLPKDR